VAAAGEKVWHAREGGSVCGWRGRVGRGPAGWSWGGVAPPPPVTVVAGEIGLEGEGRVGGSVLGQRVGLVRGGRVREVREVWERLAAWEGMRLIGRRGGLWTLCWGGVMMLLFA
jgi:hypothetical protein